MIIRTAGSLFTGIGGFDLANEWMGWQNVFQCENDIPARKVLMKNFGSIPEGTIPFAYTGIKHRPVLYSDIKNFNGKQWYGKVDIISGGFPCQPFSVAGKRKGKADDRWLWHEMRRVISEARPPWVVAENVTGIIKMDLDEVLSDLENIGYSTEAIIIPAAGVNAPHKRDRVWIIAYSHAEAQSRRAEHDSEGFGIFTDTAGIGHEGQGEVYGQMHSEQDRQEQAGTVESSSAWNASNPSFIAGDERGVGRTEAARNQSLQIGGSGSDNISTHSHEIGSLSQGRIGELGGQRPGIEDSQANASHSGYRTKNLKVQPRWDAFTGEVARTYRNDFENFPTQPPVCRRDDGLSNRIHRLRQLGNAIVPQVAYEIFKCIDQVSRNLK